jgi:hypothetical protein
MEQEKLTVEDIERKQKLLSFLFKLFVAVLILIGCIFVGWLISFVGYADNLFGAVFRPLVALASLTPTLH